MAASSRTSQPRDEHTGRRHDAQDVRHGGRQELLLAEGDQRRAVRKVDRPVSAQQLQLKSEEGQQTGQRHNETRHPEAGVDHGVEQPDECPAEQRREDRDRHRPALVDPQHPEKRRREATQGAHRQVDLPEHQDEHDAERDHSDGGAVVEQVDQVRRGEEDRVQGLEDGGDDDEADDDRKRSHIARAHPAAEAGDHSAESVPAGRDPAVLPIEGGAVVGRLCLTHGNS